MSMLHPIRKFFFVIFATLPISCPAQYNVGQLILNARSAIYYDDYILAIQYLNRAVAAKPYLYEPWYYRSIAKFYLDDYAGTEADCTEAINLNPYIGGLYELRGLARIRQQHFQEAIHDYTQAIRLEPGVQNLWFNRMLCRVELKDYAQASLDLDTIERRWGGSAAASAVRAEICMQQEDTLMAAEWLDKSLQSDPNNAQAWMIRASISMSKAQWQQADEQLTHAIQLKPKTISSYINRALSRLNLNNLRGAMADYDATLALDSTNFLAHFNRGLLCVQVGEYSKAVTDFDFIISREPENFLAIYNRATLLHRIGQYRKAIEDYTRVINEFPNFWTGLYQRAECYRRLGMRRQADSDETRIVRAQINKHFGSQPRWTAAQSRQTRKKSEIDLSKYDQIVVEDEPQVEHEYTGSYRGRVQDQRTDAVPMPMYALTMRPYSNTLNAAMVVETEVEQYNVEHRLVHPICVGCNASSLDSLQSAQLLALIDTLSQSLSAPRTLKSSGDATATLFLRSVVYADVQDYSDAIADLDECIRTDTATSLPWWQRAYCYVQRNVQGDKAVGEQIELLMIKPLSDLRQALRLTPDNPYLHYNVGYLLQIEGKFDQAIEEYTAALKLNSAIAEAYYNRALVLDRLGRPSEAVADLSRAGELGLSQAYSTMKKVVVKS